MTTISVRGRSFFEDASQVNGGTVRLWQIRLDERATETIEVGYRLLPGTGGVATEALGDGTSDVHGFLKGSIRFEPGDFVKYIYRKIDPDALPEAPESVILELTGVLNGADAQFAGGEDTTRGTSWIYDDDSGNRFATVVTAAEAAENPDGTREVEFGVFRPYSGTGTAYTTVRTLDGTATAGSDYIALSEFTGFTSSAYWGVANPKFFSVTILPDAELEGPEDFLVALDGAFFSPFVVGAVTIGDAPVPPIGLGSDKPTSSSGTVANNAIDLRGGADSYFARGGDDLVIGGEENDTLNGGVGADTLSGGRNFDELRGDDGNDILRGEEGDDTLFGGGGEDMLIGGADNDLLVGGDGNDALFDHGGHDTLRGEAGDDRIESGFGADVVFGGDGDDTILGGDGDDRLWGGDDDDVIEGGRGDNNVAGDGGDDVISALSGNDTLRGGAGNDTITAGDGTDLVFGGDGDDVLRSINDRLFLGPNLDTLDGGAGDDLLQGSVLFGRSGNDTLQGSFGADTLIGGDGDDLILSGAGSDLLKGGRGADTFVFSREGTGAVIADFVVSDDFIDLTAINETSGRPNRPAYEFAGALSIAEGLAMGPRTLWVTDVGEATMLYGQGDRSNALEISVRLEDGSVFSAADYTADLFIL